MTMNTATAVELTLALLIEDLGMSDDIIVSVKPSDDASWSAPADASLLAAAKADKLEYLVSFGEDGESEEIFDRLSDAVNAILVYARDAS